MQQRVAIYGGSFSPPGLHHRRVAELLTEYFDRVLVIPCGPRPDRPGAGTEPIYRAAMADMAFGRIPKVDVELFDLEHATFTRTHDLEGRFKDCGELWHVVGSNLVTAGRSGRSFIHRIWERGAELWQTLNFAVVQTPAQPIDRADLPPKHVLLTAETEWPPTPPAEMIFRGESIDLFVSPQVTAYIERHGLYRGTFPRHTTQLSFDRDLRPLIVVDERNAKAMSLAGTYRRSSPPERPNCILVFGGDGSMLYAIQKYWRLRLPFFGINAGHLGFLLNEPEQVCAEQFPEKPVVLRQMPMLYVEMQSAEGRWHETLTFNDAWIERSSGQSAWLQIKVNDQLRIAKAVCDGVLVSTAAGSTAYARAMGATPLLADTPAWLLVGSNVMTPPSWKSALLSMETQIEIVSLDTSKRPLVGYVYGTPMGEARAMRARISRIAAVELAFCAGRDMAEKIAQVHFQES